MTEAEWQASVDPAAMIEWLSGQGYVEALWGFTIACCRRVWDELPVGAVRRVVEHTEQVGTIDIGARLGAAVQALDRLEQRFHKVEGVEQARLGRQLGFGRMVLAFDHQDGGEAAGAISTDLLGWADNKGAERHAQVVVLRQLVPNPSRPVADEGAEPGAPPDPT